MSGVGAVVVAPTAILPPVQEDVPAIRMCTAYSYRIGGEQCEFCRSPSTARSPCTCYPR